MLLIDRLYIALGSLAGGFTERIVSGGISLALAGKANRMLGDRLFAGVVQGVAGERYVAAVRARHADGAVEKLTAGDVDALASFQLKQGGEAGLAFFCFIVDTAASEGDVSAVSEAHTRTITRCVASKCVAADVDKARVLDQ